MQNSLQRSNSWFEVAEKRISKFEIKYDETFGERRTGLLIQSKNSLRNSGKEIDLEFLWYRDLGQGQGSLTYGVWTSHWC